MNLTFVLPRYAFKPVGGYLVVFHYANQLTRRGHTVRIVHALRTGLPGNLARRARSRYRLHTSRKRYGSGRPTWFDLDEHVAVRLVPDLHERGIPNADAVFATACVTARPVAAYDERKGRKFYLVQHYEDWLCGKAEVDATWRMPFHKVVSSGWLEDIGVRLGEAPRLTHIPYGIEHDTFNITVPIAQRAPVRIGMLAHHLPFKGMTYGVVALATVRRKWPRLECVAFGATARPDSLPEWIEYVENPSRPELAELYNSFSIFVHTSITEGWGLTGAEAMACGCALVAADSGGVRDYAVDQETALLVPPGDPSALAEAVTGMLEDGELRVRLASNGSRAIQAFTWERAASRLDGLIRDICDGPGLAP